MGEWVIGWWVGRWVGSCVCGRVQLPCCRPRHLHPGCCVQVRRPGADVTLGERPALALTRLYKTLHSVVGDDLLRAVDILHAKGPVW